jgi:hypothetical protein
VRLHSAIRYIPSNTEGEREKVRDGGREADIEERERARYKER